MKLGMLESKRLDNWKIEEKFYRTFARSPFKSLSTSSNNQFINRQRFLKLILQSVGCCYLFVCEGSAVHENVAEIYEKLSTQKLGQNLSIFLYCQVKKIQPQHLVTVIPN